MKKNIKLNIYITLISIVITSITIFFVLGYGYKLEYVTMNKEAYASVAIKFDNILYKIKSLGIDIEKTSEPPYYTVFTATFDANGAMSIGENLLNCITKEDSCTVLAPTITRDNYKIIGWAVDNIAGKEIINVGEEITLYSDSSYTAITEKIDNSNIIEKTYTVSFNKNGATHIGTNSLSCTTTGTSCTVTSPSIVRNGYNIVGWSLNTSGTNIVKVGSTITLKGDATYYAITNDNPQISKTFTVMFNLNGATGIGANTLSCTTTGTSCTVTSPSIVRNNYEIIGWSTNLVGTNIIKVGSPIILTGNASYYAITSSMEKTFTAVFNPNGATTIGANSSSCITTGSSCTVTSPAITRNNYNIIGWSTSSAGTNIITVGSPITLTSNTTYYAITRLSPNYIDAGEMLSLINAERAKLGIKNLTISSSLVDAAKIRVLEICELFDHIRPNQTQWHTVSPFARGENIAAGQFSIQSAFNAWMNSEGHRNNILNPAFGTIGISGNYCPIGEYKYYWVQLFGD